MMLSNPDSYSALMTTFEELDQLQNNYEQCFGKPSHYGPNAKSAVLGFQTAIAEVKKLLLHENDMSDDAEFMQKLAEAQQKPMTPKGTDEVVDCYLSTSDRIVLSRAQEILIRLTEGMDKDHVKHIDFVEKNKERVSMKPVEYSTNLINSVARALYEIEKARVIKK